ncbi:hypothetical protein ACQJBY_028023 [Aegilops geniculata]
MVSEPDPDPDVSVLPPAPNPSHRPCLRATKSTAFKREERHKRKEQKREFKRQRKEQKRERKEQRKEQKRERRKRKEEKRERRKRKEEKRERRKHKEEKRERKRQRKREDTLALALAQWEPLGAPAGPAAASAPEDRPGPRDPSSPAGAAPSASWIWGPPAEPSADRA